MALIERLMGLDLNRTKIPIHQFQSIAAEWARGQITGAQANTGITTVAGQGLDAAEQAEAQALVNTIPSGATTANKADRALRLSEIDQVLLLAEMRVPPYDTAAAVRARLGL
jgi:hypothetical protein